MPGFPVLYRPIGSVVVRAVTAAVTFAVVVTQAESEAVTMPVTVTVAAVLAWGRARGGLGCGRRGGRQDWLNRCGRRGSDRVVGRVVACDRRGVAGDGVRRRHGGGVRAGVARWLRSGSLRGRARRRGLGAAAAAGA